MEIQITRQRQFEWKSLFGNEAASLGPRIVGIFAVLFAFNVGSWTWAAVSLHRYPVLLGTAVLAYSLGLRHAVDADHIAAIDNVTRKLMQEGKRPVAVGLMFSLGHSTIVVIGAAAIAGTALALRNRIDAVRNVGELVGTLVSAFFMLAIGAVNLAVLRSIYRAFRKVHQGQPYVEEDFDMLFGNRGLLSRLFRPIFRMIRRSWHMYPLGALFGLGFDTATEIGLLGISAAEVSKGASFGSILIFPVLFAAGMSLVDTADNILMLGAYGWAFMRPIRKVYYNMTITCVSAIVAIAVGGIEALGLLGARLGLRGGFWRVIDSVNANFGKLGYFIMGLFAVSWILSVVIYKWKKLDQVHVLQPSSLSD